MDQAPSVLHVLADVGANPRVDPHRMGKPFWLSRCWQISEQIRQDLQAAIRRAAAGEFVRYEVDTIVSRPGLPPSRLISRCSPSGASPGVAPTVFWGNSVARGGRSLPV